MQEMIKLEDIRPQGATFTLKATKNTYRLRAVSLADEVWMQETFGESLQKVFEEVRMKEVCRIVFHLMEENDKEEFASQEVTIMNEEGEKLKVRMGGASLLYSLVSGGFEEKLEIFKALMQTIGISRPVLEKLEKSEISEKKTLQPTGPTSSISSRVNMDGRQNISSRGPLVKSRSGYKPLRKGKEGNTNSKRPSGG